MSETLHTSGKVEVVNQYTEICLDSVETGREICRCEMPDDKEKADFARLAHCWNNYDQLEIDRNRWRSVAEQAMEALDEIRYPVSHMRKRLEPGEQLNGAMAIQLGSDPSYLKEIADKALAAFDSLRKEGRDG